MILTGCSFDERDRHGVALSACHGVIVCSFVCFFLSLFAGCDVMGRCLFFPVLCLLWFWWLWVSR